jgi:hypothetical protein
VSLLELKSQFGDQTIETYRYVVHWTAHAAETESVLDAGLEIIEGQPLFSTSLVHPRGSGYAHDGQPGSMLICAVPMNYHLGYGTFTTAIIDRAHKTVGGAALSYTEGRNRLALYSSEDTVAAMKRIESEVSGGFLLDQHSRVPLDPRFILGVVNQSEDFDRLVAKIDSVVRGFEAIDIERAAKLIEPLVRPVNLQATELILPALEELVQGSVEAIFISRLRVLRWQGLSLQGYRFFEGSQEVGIAPVKDMSEQQHRILDFVKRVESSKLPAGKLGWLQEYALKELRVLNIELGGASLGTSEG